MLDLTEIKAENWHIIEYIAAMAKLDLGVQEHRKRLARCLTGHRTGVADSHCTYDAGASKGWRVFLKFVDSVCKDRALVESPGYDEDFHLENHFFRQNAQFWVESCHNVFPCLRDVLDIQSGTPECIWASKFWWSCWWLIYDLRDGLTAWKFLTYHVPEVKVLLIQSAPPAGTVIQSLYGDIICVTGTATDSDDAHMQDA